MWICWVLGCHTLTLTFSWWNKRVHNDLSSSEKIPKLSFPNDQIPRRFNAHAILKCQNSFFWQWTVGYLVHGPHGSYKMEYGQQLKFWSHFKETMLLFIEMIQWNIHCICLIVDHHHMTMTECPSTNVLSTESNIESCKKIKRWSFLSILYLHSQSIKKNLRTISNTV